jgi:peptidoglycan L-alanyl-D-glutamate endopeptidase CwlK
MAQFSDDSEAELATCHPALQKTCRRVIPHFNFTVLEGNRSKRRQNRLLEEDRTQVAYPNSKHNAMRVGQEEPDFSRSDAVDLAPWPIDWEDTPRFCVLAGHMMQAFDQLKREGKIPSHLALRWGGDWDADDRTDDNKFDDLPHFEVIDTNG